MIVGDGVVLGMLLAGALAIVMLFRDRRWAPAGAVVAALAFAFGASAAWRVQHTGQVVSLAWFALTLWLMSRALSRGSARWGLMAGAGAGFMMLGRDQVALLGLYTLAFLTVAAWVPVRAGRPGRARQPEAAGGDGAGGGRGRGAAAALHRAARRAVQPPGDRPDRRGQGQPAHPASLLTLFNANLFGAAGPLENFWGQPSPTWNGRFGDLELFLARNMSVAYVGALPLLATLVAGFMRGGAWRPEIRAVSLACALMLLYALGRYTPVFGALHLLLPGVSFYRRPADALFNFGALAAILAGYCVHLAARDASLRARLWPWATAGAIISPRSAAASGWRRPWAWPMSR